MHDIKAIRENPAAFIGGLARRPAYAASAEAVAADLLARDKELRASADRAAADAGPPQRSLQADRRGQGEEGRGGRRRADGRSRRAEGRDPEGRGARARARKGAGRRARRLPNLPADDVPDGEDENANVPVRRARLRHARPASNKPKEHFDLGEALGMMDFERAAKVSGARFVYLKPGSRASNAPSAISCSICTPTNSATPKSSRR